MDVEEKPAILPPDEAQARPHREGKANATEMLDTQTHEDEVVFSIFNTGQKRWIAWMASLGAMFSTLNSYIYFPAVVPISNDLGVSVRLINLTITCYLIVAGIAPAFMGDLADHEGRRPAYVLMAVLAVGSNIGLALQKSYTALFLLRMVQSAGSSGFIGRSSQL